MFAKRTKAYTWVIILILYFPNINVAQDFQWPALNKDLQFQPIIALQLWGTYTHNIQQYDLQSEQYLPIEDRTNFLIRRTRLGFKIQPYDFLQVKLVAAIDMVGRDLYSGFNGGSNNGSFPNIGLWEGTLRLKLTSKNDHFYLYIGYYPPAVGLSSITSAFQVPSLSKSFSQAYIRQNLVGRNPGRTAGLSLGGALGQADKKVGGQYELGIHNPSFPSAGGNTSQTRSILYTGRLQLFLGDRPYQGFKRNSPLNFYNQRDGLTLGLSGSWQGKNDRADAAYSAGMDLIANWKALNINGEYYGLWRLGRLSDQDDVYGSSTGFIRSSYNIIVADKYFIEPSIMWKFFRGGKSSLQQARANRVGDFAGQDNAYDIGINWHINRHQLKLAIHYTIQDGDAGAAKPGATLNQYFFQSGLGAIQRGDWLGIGLNIVI